MYHLKLKSKKGTNVLANQLIYWYPLKITSRNQLISISIATEESFDHVKRFWAGGRIISTFPLERHNICFFYFGARGDPKISETFEERPLIVDNDYLHYFFSDDELKDMYEKIKVIKGSKENLYDNTEIEDFCRNFFETFFEPAWGTKFVRIDSPYKNCTEQIAPHPILHLMDSISNAFSKSYYKNILEFLLKKDFLVKWVDPENIPDNLKGEILQKCGELSENEIKAIFDLRNIIKEIAIELFNKYEIFEIVYLASQCGSQNSVFKMLMQNLHSLLPEKEQEYVKQGYYFFQPKLIVNSVEMHFIQMTQTGSPNHFPVLNPISQIKNLYRSLKKIFIRVDFYDIIEHKVLSDENAIFYALSHHEKPNRFRFICTIEESLDYSDLPDKIYEYCNAIKAILSKNDLRRLLRELWVKKIGLRIFTPPQLEDDVIYSLAQNWLIRRKSSYDYTGENLKARIVELDLACDYSVYRDHKFLFPFDYSSEIQYTYATLNERLTLKHNFSQFPSVSF